MQRIALVDKIAQFLADEKALAVIRPSRDGENGGGSGGSIFDDNGAALGRTPYKRESRSQDSGRRDGRSRAGAASTGCCRRMFR